MATLSENLRKALLYLQPLETYWRPSSSSLRSSSNGLVLGSYPIDFAPRIQQRQHAHFDTNGIPRSKDSMGELRYFCTTMTSFALGQWELWLANSKEDHKAMFLSVAEFLVGWGRNTTTGGFVWLDQDSHSGDKGRTCAMNQGEGISVLCRAYELTGDKSFLDSAIKAAIPFEHEYGPEGVVRKRGPNNGIWFLEGGKRILNGHIYAMFGLHDLGVVTGKKQYMELFEEGARCVSATINDFDSGFWSWYWMEEPRYIASIMYHNLHVCQLEALSNLYDDQRLVEAAKRFRGYGNNWFNRYRAALYLAVGKLQLRSWM